MVRHAFKILQQMMLNMIINLASATLFGRRKPFTSQKCTFYRLHIVETSFGNAYTKF